MNIVQRIAIGVLWIYKRVVSPALHALIGPFGGCRFHPTCSADLPVSPVGRLW
jgi:putative component of membrane protein insertase Oxa1/YidC/SpoIIIJ protein YidD